MEEITEVTGSIRGDFSDEQGFVRSQRFKRHKPTAAELNEASVSVRGRNQRRIDLFVTNCCTHGEMPFLHFVNS